MSQRIFVDRVSELSFLKEKYEGGDPEFIVLYGRRRVGKTELIQKFLEGRRGVYFLSSTEGDRENIKNLSYYFARFLEDENFAAAEYRSWQTVFESFFKHKKFAEQTKQKVVIALDEFPYLIQSNKSIPSIFQRLWETTIKKENIMLILSGSSVSVMESEVLGYNSPLYGRRTAQWQLEPMDFSHLKKFLPYSAEDLARTWFAVGGIPAYLNKLERIKNFWENMETNMLTKGSYLYGEAEVLLNEEFREPRNYKLIFKSLAAQKNSLGEICNETGLDKSMISKYLETLKKLRITEETIPVTASPKYRRRQYRITDPYMNFYFRYIYPNKTLLEAGNTKEALNQIRKDYDSYAGTMFEELVLDLARKKHIFKEQNYTRIGRWWHGEDEIDLIALNEETKEILFAECKWDDDADPHRILAGLRNKAQKVDWFNNTRKEKYAVIARKFKTKKTGEDTILVDLKDLEKNNE